MIYVDESEPEGEPESQFPHRKVVVKRARDVRAQYDLLDEIGRGKFGKVLKCVSKESGQTFAAKFVMCSTREDRRNVEREVEIMNQLNSPKLLQLFDAFENGRSEMCLVTEYIGGGELFDRVIEDEFVLTERACACFAKQILEGVAHMHERRVVHLDLKPENILCLTRAGNRVKIIDFGLARKYEPEKKLQVLFGTPEFVAPEVVGFEPISYATDMWAVGVICYVLLSGLSPFMGDTDLETMANVTIAEYDYEDEAFDSVSPTARDFIDSLLVREKERRATARQCLGHPWIAGLRAGRAVEDEAEAASPAEEAAEAAQPSSSSLSAAKQNLQCHKEHWQEQKGAHEFLFDRPSKTISIASSPPQTPTAAAPNIIADFSRAGEAEQMLKQNQPPLPAPSPHLLSVPPSPSSAHPPSPFPVPPAESPSPSSPAKPMIMPSPSTDSVKSNASSSAVITLDQIKRKAEEIVERKNSFCSTRVEEEEEEEEASGEEEEEEQKDVVEAEEGCEKQDERDEVDDEQAAAVVAAEEEESTATPKCQSPTTSPSASSSLQAGQQHRRSGRKRPPSPLPPPPPPPQPSGSSHSAEDIAASAAVAAAAGSITITQPSEPTTPKAMERPEVEGAEETELGEETRQLLQQNPSSSSSQMPPPPASLVEQLMARTGKAMMCVEQMHDGQPLWQAAERTLTPLWELATNHSAMSDQNYSSSSPAFGSSDVSKSNSELSIKGLVNHPPHHPHYHHHHPHPYHHPATKVLFTSKLGAGGIGASDSSSSSSQASSVLPASTKASTISSSASTTSSSLPINAATAAATAAAAMESSDQSSWENNSLTDESVREEQLLSSERPRRPSAPQRQAHPSGGAKLGMGGDSNKRDSKESVLTTSSDGGFSKFGEDLPPSASAVLLSLPQPDVVVSHQRQQLSQQPKDPSPSPTEEKRPSPSLSSEPMDTTSPRNSLSEIPAADPDVPPHFSLSPANAPPAAAPIAAVAVAGTAREYRRVQYTPNPPVMTGDKDWSQGGNARFSLSSGVAASSPKPFRRTSLPPSAGAESSTMVNSEPILVKNDAAPPPLPSAVEASEALFDDLKGMVHDQNEVEKQEEAVDNSQASLNKMNADIDHLLAEVDEHIRFSLNLDRQEEEEDDGHVIVLPRDKIEVEENRNSYDKREKETRRSVDTSEGGPDPISQVKSDISEVRKDLSLLRSDLSSDRKPLMDMMNSFIAGGGGSVGSTLGTTVPSAPPTSPVVKPRDAGYLVRRTSETSSSNNNSTGSAAGSKRKGSPSKEMEEVEKAMTQLAKTISEFHSPGSSRKNTVNNNSSGKRQEREAPAAPSPTAITTAPSGSTIRRGLFSAANTGSVNQARTKFERKNSEPFSSAASSSSPTTASAGGALPSSPTTRQRSTTPFRSARSPSPSPLAGACLLRHRSPSPVKTGKVDRVRNRFEGCNNGGGNSSSSQSGSGAPLGHQTLPKTFKLGAASRVVPASSVVGPRERSTSDRQSRHSSTSYGSPSSPQNQRNSSQQQPQHQQRQSSGVPGSVGRQQSGSVNRLARQESLPSSLTAPQPPPRTYIRPTSFGASQPRRELSQPPPQVQHQQLQPQQKPQQQPPSSQHRAATTAISSISSAASTTAANNNSNRRILPYHSNHSEAVKDAAEFLSQRLPGISGPTSNSASSPPNSAAPPPPFGHQGLKAPAMVNTYSKVPYGFTD